jgi:hypothetical protein
LPAGPCTFHWNDADGSYAECYENGVGFCGMSGGPPPEPTHGIVTKTDGSSLCMTNDIRYEGNRALASWKDPDGQVVATGSFSIDGSTPLGEITCGGETYEIDTSDPQCLFGSGGTPGVCEMVDTPACTCE